MTVYFKYIRIQIKSIWQYRMSLFFTLLGQMVNVVGVFTGTYLLFERFGTIKGWSFAEVALCFSIAGIAIAACEVVGRGFDMFSRFIVKGDFDRVLLRPVGTLLQIFCSEISLAKLGKLFNDFIVFIIAVSILEIQFDFFKVICVFLMIISGIFVFMGIFIMGATVCFFTVQGLEVINILTYGGEQLSRYPLTIYAKGFVRFFTFIIPFASFNYLPLQYLTGRAAGNELLYFLSPLWGILFIIPAIFVWRFGVRHYLSTGN